MLTWQVVCWLHRGWRLLIDAAAMTTIINLSAPFSCLLITHEKGQELTKPKLQ